MKRISLISVFLSLVCLQVFSQEDPLFNEPPIKVLLHCLQLQEDLANFEENFDPGKDLWNEYANYKNYGVVRIDMDLDGDDIPEESVIESLQGANFSGFYFANCEFDNAVLRSIDFTKAAMVDVTINGFEITDCEFDVYNITFKPIPRDWLTRGGILIQNSTFGTYAWGQHGNVLSFYSAKFKNVTFNHDYISYVFENCDFSETNISADALARSSMYDNIGLDVNVIREAERIRRTSNDLPDSSLLEEEAKNHAEYLDLSVTEAYLLDILIWYPGRFLEFTAYINKQFSRPDKDYYPGAEIFNDYRNTFEQYRGFRFIDFSYAYIEEGDLTGFDLTNATFSGTTFYKTDLNGAYIRGRSAQDHYRSDSSTQFWGCKFIECDIDTQLSGVIFNGSLTFYEDRIDYHGNINEFEKCNINLKGWSGWHSIWVAPPINFTGISFKSCSISADYAIKTNFTYCLFENTKIDSNVMFRSTIVDCVGLDRDEYEQNIREIRKSNGFGEFSEAEEEMFNIMSRQRNEIDALKEENEQLKAQLSNN